MQKIICCILATVITSLSCTKSGTDQGCFASSSTMRRISDKPATVKVASNNAGAYLVEDNTIDARLLPCNLPAEFLENNLRVMISGEVKNIPNTAGMPCCDEGIILEQIRRQ